MRALVVVLILAATGAAQDKVKAKPDTDKQAADKVLVAFKAKDEKALKALAEKDKPDPWLVADELCFRGKHDAAEEFAKAAPRKAVAKLPAYVDARRGKTDDAAARQALGAYMAARSKRDPQGSLAAVAGVAATDTVAGILVAWNRGVVLRHLRRFEESVIAFHGAADTAARLGWLTHEVNALLQGGHTAELRSNWATALKSTRTAPIPWTETRMMTASATGPKSISTARIRRRRTPTETVWAMAPRSTWSAVIHSIPIRTETG